MVKYGLFGESEEETLRKCAVFYGAIGSERPPESFYLASILRMTEEEEKFWKAFGEGKYCPELIFGVTAECANIEKHPMALWKCRDKGE